VCFRERAALLEDEIAARMKPADPEVTGAVLRLAEDPATRIGLLAGSAAAARRLERKFLEHVGVSPKQLARVFRLQQALRLWTAGEVAGLAQLAAAAGYADQAHLSREFAVLTGMPPQRLGARGMSHSFKTLGPERGTMTS
jgi:transcriptional regulator GlxA family with amidase domain